jgi:peptidoglycan/xylan/chitin deacetylase (PgdA/CDA1 family)
MEVVMGSVYGTLQGGREVVLTFDDGPHLKYTPRLLDYLKNENLKALFFVCGEKVAVPGAGDIVKRACEEGHLIGNHTYSHPDLRKLGEDQIRDEIKKTHDLIAEFEPEHKLCRPPYGAHNPTVDKVLRELNYDVVLWTVDPEDWKPANKPDKWIDVAVDQIRGRGHSIFLCHDIQQTTVQNFPAFIEKVRAIPKATFISYA